MSGKQLELVPVGVRLSTRDSEPADIPRLNRLLDRVLHVMRDGQEHTLRELAQRCGGGEASVSARLRDLRREGLPITKRRDPNVAGLWWYKNGETHE